MKFRFFDRTIELPKFYLWIAAVAILKIVLMGLFSSDYESEMFKPFVHTFLGNAGTSNWNPYEYYYLNGLKSSFPYPPIMLLLECVGGWGSYVFPNMPIFLVNFTMKVPSLIFDFIGLYFLVKLFPYKRKYVGILYFSSPIILYAVYMHGQLDIIPTVLLVVSIYYLVSDKCKNDIVPALLLAASLGTKLHILAVVPIILLFVARRDGILKALRFATITFVGVAIAILPFWGNGFVQTVLFNTEQRVLTAVYFSFLDIKVYIPIIAVAVVYSVALGMNIINKDLLMSFCGVIFAVFLGLCPPMPGWYVWIVPFVTLFFINLNENKYKSMAVYVLLNGLYLVYFVFFHQKGYVDLYFLKQDLSWIKINDEVMTNLCFTLLVAALAYAIFIMYKLGVTSNSLYKRRNLPFTIGIAGDSGTGKSMLIDLLESVLGSHNLLFIEGDGDHKWERGDKEWDDFTHLNPKANYIYRQAEDIRVLRTGSSVKRVEYDHDTGKFTEAHKIKPKKYVLLCGLHSLYLPQMRKNLDLKIYMDTDETLRRYWKIQRDVAHRGYSKEKILKQIEERMPDAQKYIHPQRDYADLVIEYFDKTLLDCCANDHDVRMSIRLTISAAVNVEPIIRELEKYNICVEYDYSQDLKYQTLLFDAEELENADIPYDMIAVSIIPQLEELTKETFKDADNIHGVIKLFVVKLISHKMQGEL